MPLRRTRAVILLVSGSLFVVAVLSELAVRAIYGAKFGPRPGFYVGNDRLGWKPTANLDHTFYGPDYSIDIRTDADGYRLGKLGEVDYAKELVILCGDSYSFGWGVSTHQTFASYLDEIVATSSSGQMRVVNLGVGGYGILQSSDRLSTFFEAHPNARHKLVIMQHTVNDAVDNYRAVGYHLNVWKTETISGHGSRSHLVNLCRLAIQNIRRAGNSREEGAGNPAYAQDLLWAYERQGRAIKFPSQATIGRERIEFDLQSGSGDPEEFLRRRSFTPTQRDLMRASLNCLHGVCAAQGATVLHVFLATTPDWYVQEVTKLATESATSVQCPALIAGCVPGPNEFTAPTSTGHSGGHFNGEFNRFWAERMSILLKDVGLY